MQQIYNLLESSLFLQLQNEVQTIFFNNEGLMEKNMSFDGANESEKQLILSLTGIYSNSYIFANLLKDSNGNNEELNDILIFYEDEVIIISDKSYCYEKSEAINIWENTYFQESNTPPKLKGFRKSFLQLKKAKQYLEDNRKIFFEKNKELLFSKYSNIKKIHLVTRYSGFSAIANETLNQQNSRTELTKSIVATQFLHMPNVWDDGLFYHTFDDVTFNFLINTFNTLPDLFFYFNEREKILTHYIENSTVSTIMNEELLIKSFNTKKDPFWLKEFNKKVYCYNDFNQNNYEIYQHNNNVHLINDVSQIIDYLIFYFSARAEHEYIVKYPYTPKEKTVESRHLLNKLAYLDRTARKTLTLSLYMAMNNPNHIYGTNYKVVYFNKNLTKTELLQIISANEKKLCGLTLYIMDDMSSTFSLTLTNIE